MKKTKRVLLVALAAISVFTFASCSKEAGGSTIPSTQNTPSSSGEKINYTEKEVNVIYSNETMNHMTKLRFYEETNDIPYIGIKQYYNILVKNTPLASKGDLVVTKNNNIYKVQTPKGGIATIDINNDLFLCDDFVLFNSTNYFDMSDTGLFQFDGLPFVKVKNITYNKEPYPFKVDFTKYKINLFGDNNDVYFPFNTACDLFLNENLLNSAYNQKDIYVINSSNNESITAIDGYFTPIFEKALSKEYSEYNYMELCFLYDKMCGRPNRTAIERSFNLEKGLDYALSNSEIGKDIKKLFLSSDVADYFAATQLFYVLFGDGGHTSYRQYSDYLNSLDEEGIGIFSSTVYPKIQAAIKNIKDKEYKELDNVEAQVADYSLVRSSREKMLGLTLSEANVSKTLIGNDSYYRKDKTAIIFVDNFMGEIGSFAKWKDYYNHTSDEIPFGDGIGGAVGAIYFGLMRAKEDNVENVIIDLSSNTGGSIDELSYLIAALTNQKYICDYNHFSGQICKAELEIDINLDRVIDEKDNESLVDGFNLAVISSRNGFSCGGISPIYLHEAGIFTMGDVSGGGSCSIYYIYDCYGLMHVASSTHQMVTLNGASIDAVRNFSCDYPIEIPVVDGKKNYDNLFDIDKLTEYITNHYN